MPTNEERREVARELRYTANHSLNGYSFQRAVEGIAFGTLGDRPWRETLARLADLIEPEPERTCKGTRCEETNEWLCHDCEGSLAGCMFDPERDGFVSVPKYCPHCGAKVVE